MKRLVHSQPRRARVRCITCCMLFAAVGLVVALAVPYAVSKATHSAVVDQVVVSPSGSRYDGWLTETNQCDTFVMFDVENADAVMKGDTPVVKAVGPFVYRTTNVRSKVTFDDAAGTVSYNQRTYYNFVPYNKDDEAHSSAEGLTDSHVITTPNAVLHGVIQQALHAPDGGLDQAGVSTFIYGKGLNSSVVPGVDWTGYEVPPAVTDCSDPRGTNASKQDDAGYFVRLQVRDLLWGYPRSQLLRVVNAVNAAWKLPPQPSDFQGLQQNMSAADADADGRYVAHSGAQDLQKAGQLIQFKGNATLIACHLSPCNRSRPWRQSGFGMAWAGGSTATANKVQGSTGTQFPPGGQNLAGKTLVLLQDTLTRTANVTNVGGETMSFKDIELLNFTYDAALWKPSATYYQQEPCLLNLSSVEQLLPLRLSRPFFRGCASDVASRSGRVTNPGAFASWNEPNFFGVQPLLGKTLVSHNRYQLSLEGGPVFLKTFNADLSFGNTTWFSGLRRGVLIPVFMDDDTGEVGDDDANTIRSSLAKADNATGYSIVVGSFLCVVCFMAGAFVWWHGGTVQTGQELGAEDEISGGRASLDAFEPGLAKPRGSGAPALVLGTDMSSGAGAQPLLSASSGHS